MHDINPLIQKNIWTWVHFSYFEWAYDRMSDRFALFVIKTGNQVIMLPQGPVPTGSIVNRKRAWPRFHSAPKSLLLVGHTAVFFNFRWLVREVTFNWHWDFGQWLNTIIRLLEQKLSVVASESANGLLTFSSSTSLPEHLWWPSHKF